MATTKNKKELSKKERLDLVVEQINGELKDSVLGGGMLMRGSDEAHKVETITTGSPNLDAILGGGWAKGRIVEVYGAESSGKTTVALTTIARAQENGGACAFIDLENALDPVYATNLGINLDDLLVSQPSIAEDALKLVERLVHSHLVDVIVVDSVPALLPKSELQGEIGDQNVALRARLMSQTLSRLVKSVKQSGTVLMFINQEREKIGAMGYGPKKDTPGGKALKFYASQRVEIKRIGSKKIGDEIISNKIQFKVAKNKIAPPMKTAESSIRFGSGIDVEDELLQAAVNVGSIIKRAGGHYYFADGETRIGHGEPATIETIRNDPEVRERIMREFNQALRGDE